MRLTRASILRSRCAEQFLGETQLTIARLWARSRDRPAKRVRGLDRFLPLCGDALLSQINVASVRIEADIVTF